MIGVLGGGQLGKMTALAALDWDTPLCFLDAGADSPAGKVSPNFVEGDFRDYDDVLSFGQDCDIVTIEIEAVNTQALAALKDQGKTVHPDPRALETIKDKGLQKRFYEERGIPTPRFAFADDWTAAQALLDSGGWSFPFVQKTRTGGYDGKGVAVIRDADDFRDKWLRGPSIIEELVEIDKELAVIVARNERGQTAVYPTVEMVFSEEANLVEHLMSPASLTPGQEAAAQALAVRTIEAFGICGLLAVEMFLTPDGGISVNECAPRPHNSGHHTIDACMTSQYEQLIRAISNRPLGSTRMTSPAIMLNLLGEPGYTGLAYYQGMDDCLALEGVKIHIYGKAITKPYRKMGHITIIDNDEAQLLRKARFVKDRLKCISR